MPWMMCGSVFDMEGRRGLDPISSWEEEESETPHPQSFILLIRFSFHHTAARNLHKPRGTRKNSGEHTHTHKFAANALRDPSLKGLSNGMKRKCTKIEKIYLESQS
jgi:hypothetical protein